MASALRHALEKLRQFRIQLMNKFDFSHSKKKNQQKKCVEIVAIAVRNTSVSEEGMYCKIIYGDKKKKTRSISKSDTPDWKGPISLATYSDGNLTIECWKKIRMGTSKKLLGRLSFSQAELNEAPNGRIKGWFSLVGKKASCHSTGRIFINMIVPTKYNAVNPELSSEIVVTHSVVNNVYKTVQESESRINGFGVVDRLIELRPELKNNVVEEGSVPDQFSQKLDNFDKVIDIIDSQLKTLENKLIMLNRRGTNLFLQQEIERIARELDEILAVGTKRLRQMGEDLNSIKDEDLQQKMNHFNLTLAKLMNREDTFNKLAEELETRDLLLQQKGR